MEEFDVLGAENIKGLFKALSCKTRIKIMEYLSKGESTVENIVKNFNFTQPTISHHLKVLLDAGLVLKRKYRQWVLYKVNRDIWEYIERIRNTYKNLQKRR